MLHPDIETTVTSVGKLHYNEESGCAGVYLSCDVSKNKKGTQIDWTGAQDNHERKNWEYLLGGYESFPLWSEKGYPGEGLPDAG